MNNNLSKISSKKRGGRPQKEVSKAKIKRLTMRFTSAEYESLESYAKRFSQSKYYMSLYIHSKLFDNNIQQIPGDRLIASITSIVETIDNANQILSNIACQIEQGVANRDIPASILDDLKRSFRLQTDQVRKLQKTLVDILRTATIETK